MQENIHELIRVPNRLCGRKILWDDPSIISWFCLRDCGGSGVQKLHELCHRADALTLMMFLVV